MNIATKEQFKKEEVFNQHTSPKSHQAYISRFLYRDLGVQSYLYNDQSLCYRWLHVEAAEHLSMTEEQRTTLQAWVGTKTSPRRTVLQARFCLLAADGLPNRTIAKNLKTSRPTKEVRIHWYRTVS
jgi:neutral trehalase